MGGAAPENAPLAAWAGNTHDDSWSVWTPYSRMEELNTSVAAAVSTIAGHFTDPATLAQQFDADLLLTAENPTLLEDTEGLVESR